MEIRNDILFQEKQKFNQWWVWLIVICLNSVLIFGFYRQVIAGLPFGDNPMSDNALLLTLTLALLFTFLFLSFRLDTVIKPEGIYVRFFPFHMKYQFYPWESLQKVYIRDYAPLSEYGGWELRWSVFGKGKAYNVSGDKGLQLELKNKNKLLIGTTRAAELTSVLSTLVQLKE